MKSIRIYNYEILNFDTDPVVFSNAGFTKINDQNILRALQRIENAQSKILERDTLEKILEDEKLQITSAIDFLKSIHVIGETLDAPHFKNTHIYSDLEIPQDLKSYLEKKSNGKLKILDIPSVKVSKFPTPTLCIFACLRLTPKSIKKTYTELLNQNPECGASIGFISGNYFHLTEIHIPSLGNPCAFCTLDRISHYETARSSFHHWSKIWTFCRSRNIDLPKTPIDEFQTILILGSIISFTKKLTQPPKNKVTQDRALLSRTLNLEDGTLTEESNVHWPFCECLEARP